MKSKLPHRCRFYFYIVFLLSANYYLPASFAEDPKLRPITNANSVIAIYVEDWRLVPSNGTLLILAVWEDGHIVWSENKMKGGPPYRSGKIKVEKIKSLLSRLEKEKFFSNKELSGSHRAIHSRFISIFIKSGKKQMKMESWHEFRDEDTKRLFYEDGKIISKDYERLKSLRDSSKEILFYRMMWNELRLRSSHLIPSESKPIEGKIVMKAGVVSWSESNAKKIPKEK